MEKERCKQASSKLLWALAAMLLSQNLVFPVMATGFEDQKNYYSPDPHARSPPSGSHRTPSQGTTPSHGSGGGNGGKPPSHSTPSTPSHGGGYTPTPSGPPDGNCGTPPTVPTPSTPSNPPPDGGYSPTPPTPSDATPPTPVYTPPTSGTPPTTPGTPYVPSPPFIPDPNTPFTCIYWRNHPALIWGLLGWWGTMGSSFGVTNFPGIGTGMSLQQALSNTRTDGYGTLYREGTASLLNSMVSRAFPFTSKQVRESFTVALSSNKAAAAQGQLFKLANEGRLKPRA